MTYNPTAGLDFTRQLHEIKKDTPLAIFSSSNAAREYKSQAKELGAVAIKSSVTEFFVTI